MSERTIVFKYNVDPSGNPISVKIKEIAQVSPLKHMIQLEQLPDELYGVTLLNEDNSMMKQVYKYEEVDKNPNSYYVNYTNGLIYFNSTQGAEKKVINYYGTGMELISAKRIFDEYYKADGTLVQQTLQELIDAGREAIELMKSVGDIVTILQLLETKIAEGQDIVDKISKGQDIVDDIEDATKIAQDAINVTGNEIKIINTSDWVYNPTTEMYEYTITHTMNSTNLIINCYNNDTNEFIFCAGKIINASNVLIQLNEDINLKVVLNARYYKASDFDYITEDLAGELQNAIDEAKDLTKVTGNEVVIINAVDWVYNPTNKMYEHTINHTMNSKDLIINCYSLDTGGFVFCGGKIENNDSVLIKSEKNIDLKVVLNARYYKATLTISDDIAKEVVEARKGYETVGERLDNVDLELDTMENEVSKIANDLEIATPISTLSLQGITEEKNGQNISSALTNILSNNNEKKYFYFDKNIKVDISNTLINYENSFLFGNAKINRFNPNNIFVNIADTFIKQYNGRINSCKNINQLKAKLEGYINEERPFNVCVWGDSLSTGGDMLGVNSTNPVCQRSSSPDGITRNESYYSYLVDKLSEKINTKTINFYNRAIGGTRITAWEDEVGFNSITKKWIEHIKDTAPDLLIIGFGMNHIKFGTSLKFSACVKKIIDYINTNFTKKPVLAFVTSPRPVYIPNLSTYSTYEGQASVQNTANVVRNFINNENYYVIDVNKISNIKRTGCDYINPYFYEYTDEGIVEKTKELALGGEYIINRYIKDFSLKFKVKVTNPSLNDKLVIRFNKVKGDNFNENQIGITFKNSADKTEIKSSCRIADYENWGSSGTLTASKQIDKIEESVFRIEKKGKFLSVWYGLDGENLILRDVCDVLDTNGYIELKLSGSTISASLSDITLYDAEYTTYSQSLTEKQMYGEYNGTIETKLPYGGNSVNHPTSKGISECYIPSINEFIDDIF